jgi:deoxyadenosine/deoxycytidine kinase
MASKIASKAGHALMVPEELQTITPTKRFITVAGNIGVGKSTLVELLAAHLGWKPFYETVGENPYLADFYRDMRAYAFQSQVFFLVRRLRIHRALVDHPTSAIQDRSIYEDAEVFARNLYLQRMMEERDYSTYHELYQTVSQTLRPPDLVVYLRASVSTVQQRIAHRARTFERDIPQDYLTRLNELYEAWIARFTLCPVLTVPADDLDYVAHGSHLELIVRKIHEKLAGKEEVVFNADEVPKVERA